MSKAQVAAAAALTEDPPASPNVTAAELVSLSPRDGSVVATLPIDDEASVHATVAAVRTASASWRDIGFAGRRAALLRWKRLMSRRRDEILDLMQRENGKVAADALLEFSISLEHLDWAARNAPKVLSPRRVGTGLLALNQAASVSYLPHGVVGVIGPWNYPMYTPLGSISYALAAGNGVVFKPSEHTPVIGRWLAETFADAVAEHPVFQVVIGEGPTGAALCAAGIDKLAFTGSAPTGRKVMAACAESLTPVLMELGGKDALIVDRDADIDKAAEAAVWGGMMNGGQTCAGVERVYAVGDAYEPLLRKIAERASRMRAGEDYGPITMPGQVDVISRHIAVALADGGRAVVGGPESVRGELVDPVVLADVPESSDAVQQETFGPVLIVNRFDDVDSAIEAANIGGYGLGAAVFSRRHGRQIAARLRCGMVAINDVISFGAVGALPFGGVGNSGFGRIHGADGLREFAIPRSQTRKRFPIPVRISTYARSGWDLWWLGVAQKVIGRR